MTSSMADDDDTTPETPSKKISLLKTLYCLAFVKCARVCVLGGHPNKRFELGKRRKKELIRCCWRRQGRSNFQTSTCFSIVLVIFTPRDTEPIIDKILY